MDVSITSFGQRGTNVLIILLSVFDGKLCFEVVCICASRNEEY